jgi:hypothetical protein
MTNRGYARRVAIRGLLGAWLALAPASCRDDRRSPRPEPEPTNDPILGLWLDENQNYALEVEFYPDGEFYYAYSDPSEDRQGLGRWQRQDGRFRLEVDSGMTYVAEVTFEPTGKMTVQTETAGTWKFQRAQRP